MVVGIPKEVKRHEYRVAMTPSGARAFTARGQEVVVETGAGTGSGYSDEEYVAAGARIAPDHATVFDEAQLIMKVKEPLAEEFGLLKPEHILFTYLHLAANPALTEHLVKIGITAIAYETIELADRTLPCLTPMSEIAGRLSVQEGAKYLEKAFGGRGILLGGVPGVPRGTVAIIGGGVVGTNACKIATGIGANVMILDISAKRLAYLDDLFGSRITTLYATEANLEMALKESDIVIGAVLVPGEAAPKLISREQLKFMKAGSVLVDVAIDQGGCAETSRPTTHDEPIYIVDDVVHYCVANMPGAVAYSSTLALTSVTYAYGLEIADLGLAEALSRDAALSRGLNIADGACVHPGVARGCGLPYVEYSTLRR